MAMGEECVAVGHWSVAMGMDCSALGAASFADGSGCNATGDYHVAMGHMQPLIPAMFLSIVLVIVLGLLVLMSITQVV